MVSTWAAVVAQCATNLWVCMQLGLFALVTSKLYSKWSERSNTRQQRMGSVISTPSESHRSNRQFRSSTNSCNLRPNDFELFAGFMVWLMTLISLICLLLAWAAILPSKQGRLDCTVMVHMSTTCYEVCII